MIQQFNQFNTKILAGLNKMRHVVNQLDNMRGDEFVQIKRSGAGTTVGLNLAKARERISGKGSIGDTVGGNTIKRASLTAAAGSGSTIAATLYKLDGTTGEAITVNCNISNGSDLNSAVPRLESGDDIFVTKSTFDNSGTPEVKWYCISNFQASEDCTCEQLDAVFNSVTISEDERVTFDGVGGNTYDIYNSATSEMERFVDGVKITTWKQ